MQYYVELKRHHGLMLETNRRCPTTRKDIQNGNTSIDIIEKKQATDDRQFMCGLCSKHFRRASNLKRHLLVHTEERHLFCSVCQNISNTKSVLRDIS